MLGVRSGNADGVQETSAPNLSSAGFGCGLQTGIEQNFGPVVLSVGDGSGKADWDGAKVITSFSFLFPSFRAGLLVVGGWGGDANGDGAGLRGGAVNLQRH